MLPLVIAELTLPKAAAAALGQVNSAITNRSISLDEVKESNRHNETSQTLDSDEFKTMIEQVNTSLRAEVTSEDKYVRRMRPTFGYIIAVTWAAQMLAVAAVILATPEKAPLVMNAMSQLD